MRRARETDWRRLSDWPVEVVSVGVALVVGLVLLIRLSTSNPTADRVLLVFAALAAAGALFSTVASVVPTSRDDAALRAQLQGEAHLARIAKLLGDAAAQPQAPERAELHKPARRRLPRSAVGLIALSLPGHVPAATGTTVVRYEVAVETRITFHTRRGPFPITELPDPETVAIEFEGRRFVWHALPTKEGEEYWPTVTTVFTDRDDYAAERLAMERFLSALAYLLHQPILVLTSAGAGVPEEFDPPVAHALRRGLGDHIHEAPAEVVTADDDRLRLVLGYYREGLGTASPYFRFLAFWNALDVATEDYPGRLPAWIRATAPDLAHLRGGDEPPPADWFDHLSDERRHAVAHAVREPGRPEDLDPDDPDAQGRFHKDCRFFDQLVRLRVQQRWGDYAVHRRRARR